MNSGFKVVEKATLLGFEISNNNQEIYSNFEKAIEKIVKIKNHWDRFQLSLQGRITVAKTFMLSQLNYMGSILTPDTEQLNRIEYLIASFIKGKLNISKERIFLSHEQGGLGMINIKEFLCAQQVVWVKRAHTRPTDGWCYLLADRADGNILTVTTSQIDKVQFPCLYDIVYSFETFLKKFYSGSNI